MNTSVLQIILGGLMGIVLAVNGLSILTWGFWAVILLALAMRIVDAIQD